MVPIVSAYSYGVIDERTEISRTYPSTITICFVYSLVNNMFFHPTDYQCFRFVAWDFDPATATARFHYALDDSIAFCETYHFEAARLPLEPSRLNALEALLPLLHWIAGISYYKTALPPQIAIESTKPSQATADFLDVLYRHGLGEFFFCNQLALPKKIAFPAQEGVVNPASWRPPSAAVVPLGGGKDSLVALELMRRTSARPLRLFSVGNPPAIAAVAAQAGLPHLVVRRTIDPQLTALNQAGAYNGHIPISAIIAAVLGVSAVLYEFDHAILANERSANAANVQVQGIPINHQYSKSLAFEQAIQAQFTHLLPGFYYFSLLRPLSELDIARRFAQLTQYHAVFTSCNRNFRLLGTQPSQRWCLDCPKCRFVFLALAPFMDKARLVALFGGNPLADSAQLAGYFALIGQHGMHKPFECVGEIEESLAAFYLLAQHPQWREEYIVRKINAQGLLGAGQTLLNQALTPSGDHAYPPDQEQILCLVCYTRLRFM